MTSELMTSYLTDSMDEVSTIKILEPILIQIVGVGSMIEVQSRRVLDSVLVTGIL